MMRAITIEELEAARDRYAEEIRRLEETGPNPKFRITAAQISRFIETLEVLRDQCTVMISSYGSAKKSWRAVIAAWPRPAPYPRNNFLEGRIELSSTSEFCRTLHLGGHLRFRIEGSGRRTPAGAIWQSWRRLSMKMRFILPLMASVALAIPAFAQTSAQPTTPEPAMQDQSTSAPMAKHMKGKTKGHKKMAKGTHTKAKPRAPADDQAAPQ
jgi:hypothetical protein